MIRPLAHYRCPFKPDLLPLMLLLAVVLVCGGCRGSPRVLTAGQAESRAILVGWDGGVIAEIGDCSAERERLDRIRKLVKAEMRKPRFFASADGRALAVVEGWWEGAEPGGEAHRLTLAWSDWSEETEYVRLPNGHWWLDPITADFVGVADSEDPLVRRLVSLSNPEINIAMPRGLQSWDVLSDGRWAGMAGGDLLIGSVAEGRAIIEHRIPYPGTPRNFPQVQWCPDGAALLVRRGSVRDNSQFEELPRSMEMVLLEDGLPFAEQPLDLLLDRPPLLISVRREDNGTGTRTRFIGHVGGGWWEVFELRGDTIVRTGEKTRVRRGWTPEVPSPDGATAIVCREPLTRVWIPGGAPDFGVFPLLSNSNARRYIYPFYGNGGWLVGENVADRD